MTVMERVSCMWYFYTDEITTTVNVKKLEPFGCHLS